MELLIAQLALFAAAVWMWLWLIVVIGRTLRTVIRVQQCLGVYTPWPVFRLAYGRLWLVAGGLIAIGVAVLWPEARTGALFGLFAVSSVLLAFALIRSAKLLQPRIVNGVLDQIQGNSPHDRFADSVIIRLYEKGHENPPPAGA